MADKLDNFDEGDKSKKTLHSMSKDKEKEWKKNRKGHVGSDEDKVVKARQRESSFK